MKQGALPAEGRDTLGAVTDAGADHRQELRPVSTLGPFEARVAGRHLPGQRSRHGSGGEGQAEDVLLAGGRRRTRKQGATHSGRDSTGLSTAAVMSRPERCAGGDG